jgi:hypothetical protein
MKRPYLSLVTAAALVLSTTHTTSAQTVAADLGRVIGSEEGCDLRIDQDALRSYVERAAPQDDTDFGHVVTFYSGEARAQIATFTTSEKTAFCAAAERAARHFDILVAP